MSIESLMPSHHLILFSSYFQSFLASGISQMSQVAKILEFASGGQNIGVCIRWPKYWSFSFSISPSNEYPGLISLRMDWLDLLAVQGTLESLLQHHSSKASILRCSAFFNSPTLTSIHDNWKNHSFD